MADKVKFVKTNLATYQSLSAYDPGTIYFLTDGGGLYVGNEPIVDTSDISTSMSAITPQVFTVYDETGLSSVDELFASISAAQNAKDLKEGDVFIVTTGTISAKSAYTYDATNSAGAGWIACDGNVDASKVILTTDLSLAGSYTQVGNIKIEDGVINAGKSVADILTDIFDKTINPVLCANPSITISMTNTGAKEVGSSVTPVITCTFKQGTYYQPWNNTTVNDGTSLNTATLSVEIYNGSSLLSTIVGQTSITCPAITVDDDIHFKARVKGANYNAGTVAKNNKNEDTSVQRGAGTVSTGNYTGEVTGYRAWFMYIGTDNTSTVDSTFIRAGDNNQGKDVQNKSGVSIPEGTKRILVAIPEGGKSLIHVKDERVMQTEYISKFTTSVVPVNGASATETNNKNYNVWLWDHQGLAESEYTFEFS